MLGKSFLQIFLALNILFFNGCKSSDSSKMAAQTKEIKSILDSALLSDDPLTKFNDALPIIQKYSSVDSAWIEGYSFFVKYKKGGTVSWNIFPMDLK